MHKVLPLCTPEPALRSARIRDVRALAESPAEERRLIIDFAIPGIPAQHYRAQRSVAESFAEEAIRQGLACVTVDDLVTEELKPLPYQRLFTTG